VAADIDEIIKRCAQAALVFGCGYVTACAAWTVLTSHSGNFTFEVVDIMLPVAVIGTLSALAFSGGMVVRSVRQPSTAWLSAGRVALLGAACTSIAWLLAFAKVDLMNPTTKAAGLAAILGIPGCVGYVFGRPSSPKTN
jgi:hypothetical protein